MGRIITAGQRSGSQTVGGRAGEQPPGGQGARAVALVSSSTAPVVIKVAMQTMSTSPICGRLGCTADADVRVRDPGRDVLTVCTDHVDGREVIERV